LHKVSPNYVSAARDLSELRGALPAQLQAHLAAVFCCRGCSPGVSFRLSPRAVHSPVLCPCGVALRTEGHRCVGCWWAFCCRVLRSDIHAAVSMSMLGLPGSDTVQTSLQPRRLRQYVLPKSWWLPASQPGVTTPKNNIELCYVFRCEERNIAWQVWAGTEMDAVHGWAHSVC
jgi:hypothetical protein